MGRSNPPVSISTVEGFSRGHAIVPEAGTTDLNSGRERRLLRQNCAREQFVAEGELQVGCLRIDMRCSLCGLRLFSRAHSEVFGIA